jgi:hypothetical protein
MLVALHFLNFLGALRDLGAEADRMLNSASRPFGVNLVMLLIGWIVALRVARGGNRETVELDERDLRIQHSAHRAASGLMAVLIVVLISALMTQPDLIVANALIGLLMAKTLTENVYTVWRYRREHA